MNGTGDNTESPILEASELHRVYTIGATTIPVLKGVSLSVRAGETVAIMGASGAGKSTLLHILGGLDRPSKGRVRFRDQSLYEMSNRARTELRATKIGFVFQSYHLLPELDIAENVTLPAMSRFDAPRFAAENRKRALDLLGQVGLRDRAGHRPMELSGGEQQRAALARALMNDPEIVYADEPTGNLDSKTGDLVLQYLFDLTRERGHTLILVTHNEAVAGRCDRTLLLQDGSLA
jgi:predicted ABC-type transport system involved in lysophospholipase L1 biosynthesis ATPase subunit